MGNKLHRQRQKTTITNDDTKQDNSDELKVEKEKPSFSQLCYCKVRLYKDNDENPEKGWRCRSCCRWIHASVNYWCKNRQCIYKKTSGSTYMICSDCFNAENVEDEEQKEKETEENEKDDKQFVVKKVKKSLDKIR